MSDASNNGKKPQKGALGGSPFGRNDRASEPYADIDVPDYEGATPEPAAKGASKAPAAPKAPSAPAAKTVKEPAATADKKPAAKAAPAAKTATKSEAKPGNAAASASAQTKPAEGDAPKAVAAKAAGAQSAEAKKAGTAAKDTKAPSKGAAAKTDAADPAERGAAEQNRSRDIYALVGRARPQRIEAAAPEAGPAAEPALAAENQDAAGEQPDVAEDQRTEVLDLSDSAAGTGSQGTAAQQQSQPQAGTNTATLGAGVAGAGAVGGAGGYAVGAVAQRNDADTAAQGYPAQPGDDYPQDAYGADAQWDPHAQPVEPEGELAYGPDGQPLAPAAEPVETRRGTQSLGLAILRIVAGAVLLISGLQTLFGFAGDPGISALESRLSFFSVSGVLAVAIPAAEVIAGGLLILGLLTPFAAALAFVVSAFMATFHLSGHQGSLWPYGLNPVIHQWVLYALISLSLIFTGPGGASLDRSRSWATRPLASSWIFAVLGIAGFAALWLLTGGRNPF
ncbi:DoxX family protein [Corynebacterium urealyticum]|uniref:Putative membrane protein n=1 Tax=Corynebacterium urealyticum (strain ATCC 43042 / DSM 7109) TaxID=504474 RepID=B1VG19_CORU7|nr:DoxX family protein [Corynebacterium urealyticum]QQC41816.1 DoxX family protein [Corynebacterium urealyticum]CAQ04708.1 putative membrane protein [Corynebacterium urealyticum DSM 7109]SNV80577.1 hypothetical membrane protein [Corynebacterium urealyticum]